MKRPSMLTWVAVYGIAMGYLEAAVVVYLRRIYFPHGFAFPLAGVETDIALIEVVRELATVVMLAAVGIIAGRTRAERFALFIYGFGIWDIVYYLGLKATLGWPQSLFTWDILFLFPVPWVGPVLAPCIVALTMIAFAITILRAVDRGQTGAANRREVGLLLAGTAIMLVSFMADWTRVKGPTLWRNLVEHADPLRNLDGYVPSVFPWLLFLVGEAVVVVAVVVYARRTTE